MRILALLLASMLGLGLILLVRATVDFHYRRQEENDHLEIKMSAVGGLWRFKLQIPTARLEWEEGPQLEVKDETLVTTGEKRVTKLNVRFRYFRRGFFSHLWPRIPGLLLQLQRAKTKFYRGIHCTFLDWKVRIGSEDAAYTAIAAGSFWSMFGFFLSQLYRQVTVDTDQPQILVVPDFNKPGFSCNIHCIFKLRIGHIMVIGLDLVRVFIRGKGGRI
ncbi:DUF2953 domain-containing protein [Desulfitobacterium sp.]|uniref:DUF2953 domain-containing protein n=1 Tax=Desulfitobacterium sp. TaxID=49981 RepID=UPI002CD4256A|nr:DUF2953 domain-containing protein [Desulfitobacterium sp.]HVJ48378.1 DUF2953 domain-containing protein [Desulfitobacterium sp.]